MIELITLVLGSSLATAIFVRMVNRFSFMLTSTYTFPFGGFLVFLDASLEFFIVGLSVAAHVLFDITHHRFEFIGGSLREGQGEGNDRLWEFCIWIVQASGNQRPVFSLEMVME